MNSWQHETTIDELWHSYKATGDKATRDRLMLHYAPLVKFVAGRVYSGLPSAVDQADLVSDGVIGLMDAIDKFDLSRDLKFQTYAVPRIRGAIVDGLRASDWVPRLVREKLRDLSAAQVTLERRLGRTPTDPEMAAELGVSVRQLRTMYTETAYTTVTSLDGPMLSDVSYPLSGEDPDSGDDFPAGLMSAVGELPVRDQVVVALYYWEGLTLAEIGQVLQVTESRVSQLRSRAALTLRQKLATSQN